jgi:hypothetical protein
MQSYDHNIVFEKNAKLFAEDWGKSQKIVIITSTPGSADNIVSSLKEAG